MRWLAAAIFVLTMDASGAEVHAYLTGSDLLTSCRAPAVSDEMARCLRYVASVSDTYHTLRGWGDVERDFFCKPDDVPDTKLVHLVLRYLENNPDELPMAASALVLNAYIRAFPCS